MKTFILYSILFCLSANGWAQSAAELEQQAHKTYNEAYLKDSQAAQAETFTAAAELFDEAAQAYENRGETEKVKAMKAMAGLARQNAENRKKALEYTSALSLTGDVFKIQTGMVPTRQLFQIDLGISRFPAPVFKTEPFGENVTQEITETVYGDPEIYISIAEEVGEFILPEFANPENRLTAVSEPNFNWQFGLGISPLRDFLLRLEYQQSKHEVQAAFPITAYSWSSGESTTYDARVIQFLYLQCLALQAIYQPEYGNFKPFGGLGIQRNTLDQHSTKVDILNTTFEPEAGNQKSVQWNAQLVLGAALKLHKHFGVQASYQREMPLKKDGKIEGRNLFSLGIQVYL